MNRTGAGQGERCDDEWRPHAWEYAMPELAEMLRHIVVRSLCAVFFWRGQVGLPTDRSPERDRLGQVVPSYLIPHMCRRVLILGRKL